MSGIVSGRERGGSEGGLTPGVGPVHSVAIVVSLFGIGGLWEYHSVWLRGRV